MLLELKDNDIILKDNTVENLNNAKIYLDFMDIVIKASDVVKLYLNGKEQFRTESNVFRINPTSFMGSKVALKVIVYHSNATITVYERSMELEQYFSLGKQPHEKMPQVLIDINKVINGLESRIEDLEKHKNLL